LTLSAQTEALACQQMQNKALYATRQLAKRQYTWLRKLTQLPNLPDNASNIATKLNENDDKLMRGDIKIKTFATMTQVREYLY